MIVAFIAAAFTVPSFWDWLWQRHQNQLSWYIRPLFLIPLCWFAYKRSSAGIMATVLLLLTSMGWFPPPRQVSPRVQQFLQFEQQYLQGDWTLGKVLLTVMVPLSLAALAAALWRRNLWLGLAVMALIAIAKSLWSVAFAGEAGASVIVPAALGLLLCGGGLWCVAKLVRSRSGTRSSR
ncbi:MAG: hypothetical protein ACFNYZ_06325 [Pauljensenia sp.]